MLELFELFSVFEKMCRLESKSRHVNCQTVARYFSGSTLKGTSTSDKLLSRGTHRYLLSNENSPLD